MATEMLQIDEQLLIPDLLAASPQSRGVLDRYGLRGCGGALGPRETLGFFAKAHDVPVKQLLRELRENTTQSNESSACSSASGDDHWADTIYRPFFLAGIVVVLTLGAVWGAYLLARIAFAETFTAVSIHEVNAHGHAQIFGWVGLFVMGFAYQAFPRFKHTSLAHPRWAYASLVLMVVGIIGRSVFEPFVDAATWTMIPAVAASVLEVLAIGVFVGVLASTWRAARKPLAAYDYYILSALSWFFVQALYETVYLAATCLAADREELLRLIATWQAPLREIQIHGFAMLMIMVVINRLFHHFYGFRAPNPPISKWCLAGCNLAIVGETTGLILMRTNGHHWSALWYASVVTLAATCVILLRDWRIFTHPEETDRSLKFLRTAYVWLFISLGMMVVLPIYQFGLLTVFTPTSNAAKIGFSHAYYGAARHAITVGFISLMIVGVAAKVVPTLAGESVRELSALWLPYLLINTGCALRVTMQTSTDFTSQAFGWAGMSGLLEVSGLFIWGVHLALIMFGRADLVRHRISGAHAMPVIAGQPLSPHHIVGEVLQIHPQLLDVFLSFGFTPLANPLIRKTLARHVTIRQACRRVNADELALLSALNQAQAPHAATRIALTVLS